MDVVGGEGTVAVRGAVFDSPLRVAELPAERRGGVIIKVIVADRIPAAAVDVQLEDAPPLATGGGVDTYFSVSSMSFAMLCA